MTDPSSVPALSAAVLIGDRRERAEKCLDRLLAQTILDRIEILVIDVGAAAEWDLPQLKHPAVRRFHLPHAASVGPARAEAVRQSRANVIAFIEDHTYVDRRWAEEVLKAFEKPVDVVNYAMRNSSRSTVGQMFLLLEYGRWMDPAIEGPVTISACHNIAYRRETLQPVWHRLEEAFDREPLTCRALQSRGSVVWLASRAVVEHESWTRVRDGLVANCHFKRVFALGRVEQGQWGMLKRMAFAGAMVLTPPLHIARLARTLVRRPVLWPLFWQTLPLLCLVYSAGAVAEAGGYLFDAPDALRRFLEMEVTLPREM